MPDHIHCLFLLNPTKTINDVIKQVKGSSSHYINQQNLISQKFSWQTGYAAYSVSQSIKGKVFDYIQNQKSHHKKISSQKEMDEFLELHGLKNG
jgi:REP element-mobilizing transposase RayT